MTNKNQNRRKYFGTDGIRGEANKFPLIPEFITKIGIAAGSYLARHRSHIQTERRLAVIGKDTRLSGYLIENALVSGFIATGTDVILLGPLPTPAVAMLTKSLRADVGVMISASHNPYYDNGIKFFSSEGFKLDEKDELSIEKILDQDDLTEYFVSGDKLGKAKRLDDAVGRYVEYVKQTFPKNLQLDGYHIIFDGANGAAYSLGPMILSELGAKVTELSVEPDGFNINDQCGSTYPQKLKEAVLHHKADIGIALDGDADRLVVIDNNGEVIDGDQIIAAIALYLKNREQLANNIVVTTHMSNIGLEQFLKSKDITLYRTDIGDRNVVIEMMMRGAVLGGEQSGHIICSRHSTTGDGLIAALAVLAIMVGERKTAAEVLHLYKPFPQRLINISFEKKNDPLNSKIVREKLAELEKKVSSYGRILVRKSGTEPVIRIMAEANESEFLESMVQEASAIFGN